MAQHAPGVETTVAFFNGTRSCPPPQFTPAMAVQMSWDARARLPASTSVKKRQQNIIYISFFKKKITTLDFDDVSLIIIYTTPS